MTSVPPPSPAADPRHRRFSESLVLEQMVFIAWVSELRAGRRASAITEARRLLERAVSAGAGFALSERGERLFDPIEVRNCLGWLAQTGRDTEWRDRVAASNTAIVKGDPGDDGAPREMVFSHRRRFDLAAFPAGARMRLLLPLPIPCEYHPTVSVTPIVPDGLNADIVLAYGRLEVRFSLGADRSVTIGADISLTAVIPAPRPDAALDDRLREIHLRPSEGLIRVTPRVRDLAARLGGEAPALEAVARFTRWLAESFAFAFVRYDELGGRAPIDWALDEGLFDCQLCASILVALCRARNIPARVVTGHFLHRLSPTNHNWVEIWIDGMGWRPFDPLHLACDSPRPYGADEWWCDMARRGDYRLAHQRLPLVFTGPMSVRFPARWQMFQTRWGDGAAMDFFDIDTGALIWRDEVSVRRMEHQARAPLSEGGGDGPVALRRPCPPGGQCRR